MGANPTPHRSAVRRRADRAQGTKAALADAPAHLHLSRMETHLIVVIVAAFAVLGLIAVYLTILLRA